MELQGDFAEQVMVGVAEDVEREGGRIYFELRAELMEAASTINRGGPRESRGGLRGGRVVDKRGEEGRASSAESVWSQEPPPSQEKRQPGGATFGRILARLEADEGPSPARAPKRRGGSGSPEVSGGPAPSSLLFYDDFDAAPANAYATKGPGRNREPPPMNGNSDSSDAGAGGEFRFPDEGNNQQTHLARLEARLLSERRLLGRAVEAALAKTETRIRQDVLRLVKTFLAEIRTSSTGGDDLRKDGGGTTLESGAVSSSPLLRGVGVGGGFFRSASVSPVRKPLTRGGAGAGLTRGGLGTGSLSANSLSRAMQGPLRNFIFAGVGRNRNEDPKTPDSLVPPPPPDALLTSLGEGGPLNSYVQQQHHASSRPIPSGHNTSSTPLLNPAAYLARQAKQFPFFGTDQRQYGLARKKQQLLEQHAAQLASARERYWRDRDNAEANCPTERQPYGMNPDELPSDAIQPNFLDKFRDKSLVGRRQKAMRELRAAENFDGGRASSGSARGSAGEAVLDHSGAAAAASVPPSHSGNSSSEGEENSSSATGSLLQQLGSSALSSINEELVENNETKSKKRNKSSPQSAKRKTSPQRGAGSSGVSSSTSGPTRARPGAKKRSTTSTVLGGKKSPQQTVSPKQASVRMGTPAKGRVGGTSSPGKTAAIRATSPFNGPGIVSTGGPGRRSPGKTGKKPRSGPPTTGDLPPAPIVSAGASTKPTNAPSPKRRASTVSSTGSFKNLKGLL